MTFSLQVTGHYTEDFLLNTAISRLMGLTNVLSVSGDQVSPCMSFTVGIRKGMRFEVWTCYWAASKAEVLSWISHIIPQLVKTQL